MTRIITEKVNGSVDTHEEVTEIKVKHGSDWTAELAYLLVLDSLRCAFDTSICGYFPNLGSQINDDSLFLHKPQYSASASYLDF